MRLDFIRVARSTSRASGEFVEGAERALSTAAARADEEAIVAGKAIRAFDKFLVHHGAPVEARLPPRMTVVLDTNSIGAQMAERGLVLGSAREAFRLGAAHSDEIVGHELAHLVHYRQGVWGTETTLEGWGDIVGNAFARHRGAPGADDWRFGEGVFKRSAHPAGHLRDLAHPDIADVPALLDSVRSELQPLGGHGHKNAGVFTRVATDVAERLSAKRMSDIYLSAFLHDLPARSQASIPRFNARLDAYAARHGDAHPRDAAIMALGELRASARATLDAAARLHGEASVEFQAVRDAWNAAGLRFSWLPRSGSDVAAGAA